MRKARGIALMMGLLGLSATILTKKVNPIIHAPYYLTSLTIAGFILLFLVFTYYKMID